MYSMDLADRNQREQAQRTLNRSRSLPPSRPSSSFPSSHPSFLARRARRLHRRLCRTSLNNINNNSSSSSSTNSSFSTSVPPFLPWTALFLPLPLVAPPCSVDLTMSRCFASPHSHSQTAATAATAATPTAPPKWRSERPQLRGRQHDACGRAPLLADRMAAMGTRQERVGD